MKLNSYRHDIRGFRDRHDRHGVTACFAVWIVLALSCAGAALPANAAELRPETLKAWNAYVAAEEKRMEKELSSPKGTGMGAGFLALDFQDKREAAQERRSVLGGEIVVQRMPSGKKDQGDNDISIPSGTIHHWRGSVFIPDVPFDFTLHRIQHPELETSKQEDVLESRILERRSPAEYRLFLKLQRTQIITVVYNTEHQVRFRKLADGRASSSSVAVKIAEVERLSDGREQEKPAGQDRGFLWKMNSYWRYQQVQGGVLIECESITLSRAIPSLLEGITRPVVNNIARESMQRTLRELRQRLLTAYQSQGPKAALAVTGSIR
jgi:hypothetical protein